MRVISPNSWHTYSCISSEQTSACMLFCRWRVGCDPDLEPLGGEKRTHVVCHAWGKKVIMFINKTTTDLNYTLNLIFIIIRI